MNRIENRDPRRRKAVDRLRRGKCSCGMCKGHKHLPHWDRWRRRQWMKTTLRKETA